MPKAAELMDRARECERLARLCPLHHEREAFERLAGLYRELADDVAARQRPLEPKWFDEP